MSEQPQKKTMLDWWLRYLGLGWRVIRLSPRSKVPPAGTGGSHEATLDEQTVRGWYAQCPQYNIGLATGYQFFVLDVDVYKGGDESLEAYTDKHGPLPDTIEQTTGRGGRQLFFLTPDFKVLNSAEKLGKGLDVRGDGGYVVAPPSIHPETGRRYLWDGLKPIEEQAIATAPAWLLEWLRKHSEGRLEQQSPASIDAAKPIPEKVTKGQGRHDVLLSIAGTMRRRGLDADEIYVVLSKVNKERCDPPYDELHLRTMAASMMKYPPDARFNLFKADFPAPPEEIADSPQTVEVPVNLADVEAAVEEAAGRKDLVAVMRLAPEVAKLRQQHRAVIKAQIKVQFGREWTDSLARDFDRAVADVLIEAGQGQNPPAEPPAGGESADGPLDGKPNLLHRPLTDGGNGERIALLFRGEIRFCTEMKKWLVWDGKRWGVDEQNIMRQKGKEMARLLYAQALHEPSESLRKAIEKHARASESYAAISNALGQAATEPGIPISALQLDQHPFYLNCENGVVDLRTGRKLPHDREFYITKLCPTPYIPKAECPRFQAFVEWAMGGNQNPDAELSETTVRLVSFLQRALGYGLTGDVSQKCVFVFYGQGGDNGKTTLLTLFRNMLGRDYANLLLIESIMSGKTTDSTARADMADLRGARFVQTSEVGKEDKLNDQRVKYLTQGMGWIKSRRLYENPLEFEATHKLYMDCNYRPKVRGTDDAIWRRLKLVPFTVTIEKEKRDLQLQEKLAVELPGVLAWAVRGYQAMHKEGLGEPPEVTEAGEDWRENDDPIKDFLDDCCEEGEEQFCLVSDLMAAYQYWAKQAGERFPLNRSAFNELLCSKGFRQGRKRIEGKQDRFWFGVDVNNDTRSVMRQGKQTSSYYHEPVGP